MLSRLKRLANQFGREPVRLIGVLGGLREAAFGGRAKAAAMLRTLARLENAPPPVVIVPIHNAAAELAACLAALVANTPPDTRIILLDDASTDPAVAAILSRYAGLAGVERVRQPVNLGFTRTANRGLAMAAPADAVLLNSDTEVTPRWLYNLRLAAYSSDRTGTATPFSDNAGAFSAPAPDRPNPRPAGLDRDAYARLVTQASARRYPRVPTGGGFCLYLRRDCLDDTGEFDAEAFPRGYGEENDFCLRAGRRGWFHVVDDATLIDHARSASFGDEKSALLATSRAVLARRYPDYPSLVRGLSRAPALTRARAAIAAAPARWRRSGEPVRPRLLTVIATTVGGTPQTNQDLMAELADRFDTLVLHSDARNLTLSRFRNDRYRTLRRARLPEALQPFPHASAAYDGVVAGWLVDLAVELVHIRHIGWHSLGLPRLAKTLGVPVVFSFHDYYAICPTVRLVDENDTFCGGACTATPGPCTPALWRAADMPPLKHRAVHDWRAAMAAALDPCDAFVTTSDDARDRIRRFFPATAGMPFPVIEHGRTFLRFDSLGRFPEAGERIRVLVPGNISTTKGARILARLRSLDEAGRCEFHVVGQASRTLEGLPGIVLHGPYARQDFAAIAARIRPHVGVILSIWAETFCHTLTEMWAAGLPVAAFDLGAVGERIRRHGGGWLMRDVTAEAAWATLSAAAADAPAFDARLEEVAAWQAGPGRRETARWMADSYAALYASLPLARIMAAAEADESDRRPAEGRSRSAPHRSPP